ncbi:hypothetical protein [Nocardiopsis potens]|uniref:hypothetical protein n=1 Tax=Nocardiopsis potens TaxID=1246458 RepID=UPI00126939B8|nr:hypothetical protein [Nocardiopsis potens]
MNDSHRPPPPRWSERRIPEYVRKWAERTIGSADGVDPVDYLDQASALDAAIAAAWLFCPETVEYRGGIFLKRRFSSTNVDRWLEEHDLKTTQATVNLQYIGDLYPHVEFAESDDADDIQLLYALAECWYAVCTVRHPGRRIHVSTDEDADGLSPAGPSLTLWTE